MSISEQEAERQYPADRYAGRYERDDLLQAYIWGREAPIRYAEIDAAVEQLAKPRALETLTEGERMTLRLKAKDILTAARKAVSE